VPPVRSRAHAVSKTDRTKTRRAMAERDAKAAPVGDVLVAWVHSEWVAHSWFTSIMNVVMAERRVGPYIAMKCGTDGLVAARNQVVVKFLESDAQWLFWVDTDMGFLADTVSNLLEHADPVTAPVVGALCFSNKETHTDGYGGNRFTPVPTLYHWVELPDGRNGFMPIADYPRDAMVPVAATGSACIVIHRSVFERIAETAPNAWYTRLTNPTTGQLIGEDMSFCYRAANAGVPMFVNTGVKTTHLKPVYLQEADYAHPHDLKETP